MHDRIQQLSPRLANQIAAGEVVERPSSVIKELLENSLDAGATRLDVDIEKGGIKRMKVRDNGKGIDQDDLALALARHATSKIHALEDLDAVATLGFRGEALASISSVARLILTSSRNEHGKGWQVSAEGREMRAQLTPAAHPRGTTVDARDLFSIRRRGASFCAPRRLNSTVLTRRSSAWRCPALMSPSACATTARVFSACVPVVIAWRWSVV